MKFFYNVDAAESAASNKVEEQQSDDGLGYYDDGVKRTLTDEQIAIFRHSEIQRYLTRQRLKEVGDSGQSSDHAGDHVGISTIKEVNQDGTPVKKRTRESKRERKRRQKANRAAEAEVRSLAAKNYRKAKRDNLKRRRDVQDEEALRWSEDSDGRTKRRKAREADECENIDVEMDY